jgi:predicted ester cyclase
MSEERDPQVRMPVRIPEHARQHFNRVERQKKVTMRVMALWLHEIHGDPLRGDEPDPEATKEPKDLPVERPQIENPAPRAMSRVYLDGISDVDFKVVGQLAHTDIAASRWEIHAMHTAELLGMPGTGREIELSGMTIMKFADNQATEEWTYWDIPGLMEQVGAKL